MMSTMKAVPLLAAWGWGDEVQAASTHPCRKYKDFVDLQRKRYAAAIAIDRQFSELSEFVSLSSGNFGCHSSRVSMLFVVICMEIESCFKSILSENCVSKSKQKNIEDFSVVEQSHSLSAFKARFHGWIGNEQVFEPFAPWAYCPKLSDSTKPTLPWYSAYGKLKHNTLQSDKYGTFENLCTAMSALHILLVSQFGYTGWGPARSSIGWKSESLFSCEIGNNVEVRFPDKAQCRVVYDLPRTWSYDVEPFGYI